MPEHGELWCHRTAVTVVDGDRSLLHPRCPSMVWHAVIQQPCHWSSKTAVSPAPLSARHGAVCRYPTAVTMVVGDRSLLRRSVFEHRVVCCHRTAMTQAIRDRSLPRLSVSEYGVVCCHPTASTPVVTDYSLPCLPMSKLAGGSMPCEVGCRRPQPFVPPNVQA